MLIKKKELFKRKNRIRLYHMYENAVDTLAAVTEQFESKLKAIRKFESQYKNSEHIYNMLYRMDENMSDSFNACAFYKGQLIKSTPFTVNMDVYENIHSYIATLLRGIGNMECLIDTITYMEMNELGVRSI